ncbi:MAG TPA: carboxypeptidase-like regulatory domain-containing protein, partial [Thermoanaerobaculia bacterium]
MVPPHALARDVAAALTEEVAQKAPATGAIVGGKVVDPSGAVVVGATVTLTAGNHRFETTSDSQGRYHFDQVPPGSYTILAFHEGFSPKTQEVVTAIQPVALDLKLEIAGFSEEVMVAFTAAAALSAMKTETPIADIPLSVQSYTESFMKAIETTNVADLYNYTTGVARSGNT